MIFAERRTKPSARAILCAAGLAALSGPALARGGSYTPPAGQAPATAPGGTVGLAGPRNVEEAIRSGQAVGVPPGSRPGRSPYGDGRGRVR